MGSHPSSVGLSHEMAEQASWPRDPQQHTTKRETKTRRIEPTSAPIHSTDRHTDPRPQRGKSASNPRRGPQASHDPTENESTVGIEDRWYMRRTPPPSRPPWPSEPPPRRPPPSRPPLRPSPRPLPRRRTGAGVRMLIIALVGIILILAMALASVEAQRCREGLQAPVCRI
jgi:hypothetical protein